jgi:hypothetical protein
MGGHTLGNPKANKGTPITLIKVLLLVLCHILTILLPIYVHPSRLHHPLMAIQVRNSSGKELLAKSPAPIKTQ